MKITFGASLKDAWIGIRVSSRFPIWTLDVCPLPFVRISLQWKSPSFLAKARRAFKDEDGCKFQVCGEHGVVGMAHGLWEPRRESDLCCPECGASAYWRQRDPLQSSPADPMPTGRRTLVILDELGGDRGA